MNHPYNKHDALLGRDLTPSERMEGVRATITWTHRLLDQIDHTLANLPEDLGRDEYDETERLFCFAAAVHQIYNAAENTAFLGEIDFRPHQLRAVSWDDEKGEKVIS